MSHPPYTDEEAAEARTWVCKYGPPNSWTAGLGTAARMIGRLLKERERLSLAENEIEAILFLASYCESQSGSERCEKWRATMGRMASVAREAVRRAT